MHKADVVLGNYLPLWEATVFVKVLADVSTLPFPNRSTLRYYLGCFMLGGVMEMVIYMNHPYTFHSNLA